MNLLSRTIISNADMINNYRTCREKAEKFGKLFILKNNQPDAILFSITEYERFSALIEYMESLEEKDIKKVVECLPKEGHKRVYSIDHLREDLQKIPIFIETI